MKKEEAFEIGLPKWLQCVIDGEKISEEQAMEIIRRTDNFFINGSGGNNHDFNKKVRFICKFPEQELYKKEDGKYDFESYYKAVQEYEKKWNIIPLEYLSNDWVSSSYIYGPNGWCHPDGTIHYRENIGKWPNVEEVYEELARIAKEFPFLTFNCTLMSGEHSEDDIESLVTMHVENGKVTFRNPINKSKLKLDCVRHMNFLDTSRENALSLNQIKDMSRKVYGPTFRLFQE